MLICLILGPPLELSESSSSWSDFSQFHSSSETSLNGSVFSSSEGSPFAWSKSSFSEPDSSFSGSYSSSSFSTISSFAASNTGWNLCNVSSAASLVANFLQIFSMHLIYFYHSSNSSTSCFISHFYLSCKISSSNLGSMSGFFFYVYPIILLVSFIWCLTICWFDLIAIWFTPILILIKPFAQGFLFLFNQ